MKKLFLSFVFSFLSIVAFAQNNWSIDHAHSSVNFNVGHMDISFVQGRFDKFGGTITTKGMSLDNAAFEIIISTETINTGIEARDNHLKSEEFFASSKYPEMKFEGTTVTKEKDGTYMFKGKLTVKDITKEISVPATLGGMKKNKEGKDIMGLQAKLTINRFDYGINYDPTATGIAKNVDVNVYLELVKK